MVSLNFIIHFYYYKFYLIFLYYFLYLFVFICNFISLCCCCMNLYTDYSKYYCFINYVTVYFLKKIKNLSILLVVYFYSYIWVNFVFILINFVFIYFGFFLFFISILIFVDFVDIL